MLKEQLLKEFYFPSNKRYRFCLLILAFVLCANIIFIIYYLNLALELAANEKLILIDLGNIDLDQDYKGTIVKAILYFFRAIMQFLVFILFAMQFFFLPYTRRKQKRIVSLINQIPDEI